MKAGKSQGAKISSLIIEPADADAWHERIEGLEDEIAAVEQEEKEEHQLAQAEMQIRKGENMVAHEDEIKARPRRTWFETQADKKKAKEAGRAELNGFREALKKKGGGKLSGKDLKKLDARAARKEDAEGKGERMWKKGAAERAGKGAVMNSKKDKAKGKDKDKAKKKVVGAKAKAKVPARGKAGKRR